MMDSKKPRIGDWIETYTGKEFYPYDPRIEDVCIEDIAHALSLICRFNGHTRYHYSVAQHSLNCAELAARMDFDMHVEMYALLHDAAEAYICDIPRPIKKDFAGYAELESNLQRTILSAFGLPDMSEDKKQIIKELDDLILHLEARTLLPVANWAHEVYCKSIQIEPMSPRGAEVRFLESYKSLTELIRCRRDGVG